LDGSGELVVLGLLKGYAANYNITHRIPELSASPTVTKKLPAHIPLAKPIVAQCTGGLFVEDNWHTFNVTQQIKTTCIEERVASNRVTDRQRDSEGKLDKRVSLVIEERLDVVEKRWVVREVVVESTDDVLEALGVALEAIGEVRCAPLREELGHGGGHHVIVVTWNTCCFTRKSISSGAIQATGECCTGNKVNALAWGAEMMNMCKLNLLPARLGGIDNC